MGAGEESWGEDCGRSYANAGAGAVLVALDGQRSCEGAESFELVLVGPEGRWQVVWERAGGEGSPYTLIGIAAPPRYAGWYADDTQCEMRVGATGLACLAGAPPPPPPLAWGRLLP